MARPAYTSAEREEIETDIRRAALKLFAKVGYRGTSLRAIAKELGWSATALYRYYDNKESLVAAIRADGFKEMQAILSSVHQAAASGVDAGAMGIRAYVAFASEKQALYQLMYELDQGEVAELPIVRQERRKAFAAAEAIAADVIQETNLSYTDNELAHLMWVAAHGLAALQVASQLDLGMTSGELIGPVVQTLMRGLLNKEQDHV